MTKHPQDRHSRRLVVPLTPEQDAQARAYARRVGIPLAAIARNALLEIVNAPPRTDSFGDGVSCRGGSI
jgi:hypothetical protein